MSEDGIEKSDHCLSSHGKPRDANWCSRDRFFYPTLTLMMDLYYHTYSQEEETPEDMWCQDMEKDLSDKGVNIKAETLQRYSPLSSAAL